MTGMTVTHGCYPEILFLATCLFLLFLIVAYESSLKRPQLLTYCDVLSYFDNDFARPVVSTVTTPIVLVFGSNVFR
jgi:hypothetical protein